MAKGEYIGKKRGMEQKNTLGKMAGLGKSGRTAKFTGKTKRKKK